MIRRRLSQFTDSAGTNAVTFSDIDEEWEQTQPLVSPRTQLVGADYAYDQLGNSAAIKGIGVEVARFQLFEDSISELNSALDTIRSGCVRNGRGKLWSIEAADTLRWCWARVQSVPDIRLMPLNVTWAPVAITFDRLSDWYAEDATLVTETASASPTLISVSNAGNAPVRNAIIELRAGSAGGFDDFTLESLSTGDSFSSARTAAGSSSRLRIHCGKRSVEYSNDAGATWAADYGNFSYGAKQVDFLRLEAGNNSLRFLMGTTPDVEIRITFYAAWD